jgi:hypothetical protein
MTVETCEALEESLILFDVLSPTHNEHASNCERCQATLFMTKSIETELAPVPASPAHKPLWIRELHARQMQSQRRKRWALGGMVLAAAATVLALAGPRLVFQNNSQTTNQAKLQHAAEQSEVVDTPEQTQAGAARPSRKAVRFTLGVVDLQGKAASPVEATRLLEWRLSQRFSDIRVAVDGQDVVVDIGDDSELALLVSQVNSLLESPLGVLSFSISRVGFMQTLCEYVSTDENARASGIGTGIDQWSVDGQGSFERCYLTAKGSTEGIGRRQLEEYLSGLDSGFQVDAAHWFGFGPLGGDSAEADLTWRTHYLQAPTPGLDGLGIKDASIHWNEKSNAPEVMITFREQAAAVFAQLTADNVGQKIVLSLDSRVIFDATIATKIGGGSVAIDVGAQAPDAETATRELVDRIRTGPLSVQVLSFARIADGS